MGEQAFPSIHFDRTVEQAILAIKKGAYLLKCGRRGKPKFCPFRLSTDEKYLIWYSGRDEKQLRLSSVTKIITGQKTVNFQRKHQQDRDEQSFSLIYANGERTLDLICKDKAQHDSWIVGLRAVISKSHHSRTFSGFRSHIGVQSCVNSPAGYSRRKHNLGLLEDAIKSSQVRSLCGSPSHSLKDRCFSDGLSQSSDSLYASELSISRMYNAADVLIPNSPCNEPDSLKKGGLNYRGTEFPKNPSQRFVTPIYGSPQIEKNDLLKDVMIWGEGVLGGNIGGVFDKSVNHDEVQIDALLPKLLESTMMLDVRNISLGGKHAALVTKEGEVFCWGEGNGGKLGHKVNMDVRYPKLVESLNGVLVQSVTCGEYQTCAVSESGELYTWGGNNHGGDFLGEVRNRSHWLPCKISGPLDGVSVLIVACGEWHTAIVSTSGKLFTYGDGTFGVLGHGNLKSFSQPKEVESLRGLQVNTVSCGPWHTAAIVEIMTERYKYNAIGGKLYTWGDGDKGRIGHDDGERKLLPTCIARLVDHDFVQVSCGRTFTVALTSSGTVYTMGSTVHGQLGNPQAKDKSITMVEGKLKGEFVKEISSGSYHIVVLTVGGSVYTWGKAANGQLGLGDTKDRNSPTLVEALRDRLVENIACRSSLTAAICLHKSISLSEQSTCSGCKMPFGFTRRKHNCYNCGLLFCSACSNKKVINASLARNKSKPSRVCDPCFNHVQKISESGRLLKLDNHSPSLLLTPRRTSDEKEERGKVTPKKGMRQLCNAESQSSEKKTLKNHEEKQQHLESTSLSNGQPRWGQVSCPVLGNFRTNGLPSFAFFKSQLSSVDPPSLLKVPQDSNSTFPSSLNVDKSLSESNNMLTEEVDRLRTEVRSLEMRCQLGNHKIQECLKNIDDTWLLAKEEAAKCKAAKEVIKALALRQHKMEEKVSARRKGTDANLSQVTPVHKDSSALEHPMPVATLKVKLLKERQGDSLCSSPIVFSDTLKSMYGRDAYHEKNRSLETSHLTRTEPQQNSTKASKEWVEEYERGVYVTLTILPSGQKGLKRVRFSRKQFTEKEAERWWEENQVLVYENYGIEGYSNSNDNRLRS